MMIRPKAKKELEFLPQKVVDNLAPDEKIFLRIESVSITSTTKMNKTMMYLMIIMALFVPISVVLIPMIRGRTLVFGGSFLIIMLIIPVFLIMFLFIFKKRGFAGPRKRLLFITNKKLLGYSLEMGFENLTATDLSSLRGVFFERNKDATINEDIGKIVFVSETFGLYAKEKYVLENVENFVTISRKIESIFFHFKNLKDKKFEPTSHKFESPPELWDKCKQTYFKNKSILLLGIILTIGGILLLVLTFDLFTTLSILLVLPVSVGFTMIMMGSMSFYQIRKVFTDTNKNDQIIVEKDKVILKTESGEHSYAFSENFSLDFTRSRDFSQKLPKTRNTQRTLPSIGTIIFDVSENSREGVKAGPFKNYIDIIETIYLNLLAWEYDHGLLLNENNLTDFREELTPAQIAKVEELKRVQTESALATPITPIDRSSPLYETFKQYLDPNEEILLEYRPEVNVKSIVMKLIIGIAAVIGIFVGLQSMFVFNSILIGIVPLFVLIFPMMLGCFACMTLPGALMEKKSCYVFTNRKIMIQYPKRFLITPLSNIESLDRMERKQYYYVQIRLIKELPGSPYIDKKVIFIHKVPKTSDLIDKIKYIKNKYQTVE